MANEDVAVIQHGRFSGHEPFGAVFLAQFGNPPLTGAAGRDLGVQIPRGRRRIAQVARDHRQKIAVRSAPVIQLHRRQDQPFAKDLQRGGIFGSGHRAAHIHMMRDGRCHGDQAPPNDHGREQHDVGRVRTARKRIVADDDVTGPPAADRDRLGDVAKGGGHDAKLRRDGWRLGDQLAFAVQKPAGIIDHVPDDRRIGRAAQGRGHFLGD